MSELRPLPPVPNLEFERKEAKALLRQLRAGEPEAVERVRHLGIDGPEPAEIKLSDVQLVIAREYGFTSWPRLVSYYSDVDRQRQKHLSSSAASPIRPREFCESDVEALLKQHGERRTRSGRLFARYVPRFYGMPLEDIFDLTVNVEDARLAVARVNGFPSWKVLLDRASTESAQGPGEWDVDPMQHAIAAMKTGDLDELRSVVDTHPDLLHPTEVGRNLLNMALGQEKQQGIAAMRPIIAWLGTKGLDVQTELNRQLCGHIRMETEKVRWLLDRGADANWVAPNSIPVLEHALIKYWNREAVDLVAARVTPRKALWIAAGLGDLEGVRGSLDGQGKPIPAAYRIRPDFDAVGPGGFASHPDPGDEEILLEAFLIAMFNGRTEVLAYMVSRGFPVDSLLYESPVINMAVGNAWTSVVECLIRCGADLDLKGRQPNQSAREIARDIFENSPQSEYGQRMRPIVELCGMDPDAILAERDARPLDPPGVDPKLQEALEFAGDDAFRLKQSEITPENLFIGLLRSGGRPVMFLKWFLRAEFERFGADMNDRVDPENSGVDRPKLTLDPGAQQAIRVATAAATERRHGMVKGLHLLFALTQPEDGAVADLLSKYGSSASEVNGKLAGAM